MAGNTTPVGSSASPAKSFVTEIQKVTGISISPSGSVIKNINENFTISATISPSDANNKTINWNSTNKSVATVDGNGKVTCLSAGSTTITATAADGSGVSASLSLTVRNPINSLTLDKDQTTILKDGYTSTVTATTDPSNYDGANISWTIADTSIATVNVSGKTATIKSTSKIGQTTLTVLAGGITKTVKISVVNFVTQTYSYTGKVQAVELPAGTYKLEVWGASGGDQKWKAPNSTGGKGGYSVGTITLTTNTVVYVYIGQQGETSTGTSSHRDFPARWNGGGGGYDGNNGLGSSGGGATDIALYGTNESTNWNNANHLYSRIIVAGGGGGAGAEWGGEYAGYGGGTSGGNAGWTSNNINNSSYSNRDTLYGRGATQTSTGGPASGGFGYGGTSVSPTQSGGGGGGWYGGGGQTATPDAGGGGGSGYVYTSTTASNYPSGCLLNSSYYLINAQTIAGNQSFPSPTSSGNETGHSGNGYARITPVN